MTDACGVFDCMVGTTGTREKTWAQHQQVRKCSRFNRVTPDASYVEVMGDRVHEHDWTSMTSCIASRHGKPRAQRSLEGMLLNEKVATAPLPWHCMDMI
eukprot:1153770-Pelagomonas_calceolata.AAC.4